ncbi:antibiotic biosynthesis monooxygenase family protein [Lunatimonas salinarum]|uniref:antibiotic biosynthesis monooxygenase family protein n=1 Tax=Lunatimonas salinarum TaxID=1774590 RepID=UPI001AE0193F|nr:antibiotic biosynthesis monooxygenase [Lunatimonas salinarum]
MIAQTPTPPYYAVIFTSVKRPDDSGYSEMAKLMEELVVKQPGYLGHESARDGLGITVSYWDSLESIAAWKEVSLHKMAQKTGKERWYAHYSVRICRVEKAYEFP